MARKTYGYDRLIDVLEHDRKSLMTGIGPRDSDKEMLIQVMQFEGAGFTAKQMDLIRKFNFESLRRTRAKLQSEGKYLGSPEVMKKRGSKGAEVQQVVATATAQEVHYRIQENS